MSNNRSTLWLGLALIAVCQILLYCDLQFSSRGAIQTDAAAALASTPHGPLPFAARFVAINMTPLAWLGYIIFLDGLLAGQFSGSPARRRPNHFALCCLASIVIWCFFDAINFYCFQPPAWTYIGLPLPGWQRAMGYTLAFAAIVPGVLLSGQVLMNWGIFDWARGPAWKFPRWAPAVVSILGGVLLLWPILSRNSAANAGLWTGLVLLLDPINYRLGRPSLLRDWRDGWYARTLAAAAGGLVCGLLWEFWNYWALEKWIYHLPFLGAAEQFRYFQMPLPGLLGFIPFGMECWIMWQMMRIPLDGLAEPLPGSRSLM